MVVVLQAAHEVGVMHMFHMVNLPDIPQIPVFNFSFGRKGQHGK